VFSGEKPPEADEIFSGAGHEARVKNEVSLGKFPRASLLLAFSLAAPTSISFHSDTINTMVKEKHTTTRAI